MQTLKKLILIFGLSLLTGFLSFGQSTGDPAAYTIPFKHLPAIGVPSPNAASLGTYASSAVKSFTGTSNINIPIWEINEHGFKLPISLSYNVAGVKVNDIAGWTGLGWSLNAGGLVTRNVVGAPDDENDYSFGGGTMDNPSPPMGHTGFLYFNYNKSALDIKNYWSNTHNNLIGFPAFNINSNYQGLSLRSLRFNLVDTEPDIFSYNFNGHSGKFVFSQGSDNFNIGVVPPDQHKVLLVPYTDLQVNYQFRGTEASNLPHGNYSWIKSFTIKDEDGNQYVFDQAEYQNSQVSDYNFYSQFNNSGHGNSGLDYFSSWYLSRITTVMGKVINFTYTVEQQEQDLPTAFRARAFNLPGHPTENAFTYTNNYIQGLRLTTIEGDDYKVYFDAALARQDTKTNALTGIRIYAKDATGIQTLMKEVDFNYMYLQSNDVPANNDVRVGDTYQRLMLDNIVEKGSDGSTTKAPYKFNYNNSSPLPNRFSAEQDFWGYYNQNGSTSKIPTVYVYPSLTGKDKYCIFQIAGSTAPYFNIAGANRNTNPNVVACGTLSQITYPTGGTTAFQFEPNVFTYNNQTITGGGLRLAQTIDYDGISHNYDITKKFNYTQSANPSVTSGVLFNLPVYTYVENFFNYWDQSKSGPGFSTEFNPATIDYYNHNLVIGDIPQFTMSGFDGLNVAYSEITEVTTGNGKIVSAYSTPGRYGDYSDQSGGCDPNVQGYCDGLFTLPTPSKWSRVSVNCSDGTTDRGPDLTGMDLGTNYTAPFAPSLNYDWNRGLLISKIIYNESGAKVSEEHNAYSVYTPQNSGPLYVLGLRNQRIENYILYQSFCAAGDYDCYSQYKIITNMAKPLSSKVLKIYDRSNSGTSTQTISNYSYSTTCLKPNLIETTTSKSELIDKYLTYPLDYPNISANTTNTNVLALYNIQQKHVINPVVEEYTIRKNADGTNPKVIGGYLTSFKTNQPLADSVFRSESITPIANYMPATIGDNGIIRDKSYKPFLSFDKYDTNGNILQQRKIGDANSSYIWDYNNQFPIAKVTNAASSNIAYTSFEADGTGNWTVGSVLRDNTTSARTGKSYYVLSNGAINKDGLNSATTYLVSYWTRNVSPYTITGTITGYPIKGEINNGWTYFEHRINGQTTVTLSGTGSIDEVRLYPSDAQMTTYTYDPLVGMTSSTDAKGMTTTYEYDGFQRLLNVKDKDGNITKHNDYHYQNQ